MELTNAADLGLRRDEQLVDRAAHGDAGAFEALVAPRLDRTFRTACAILGNEADARDAVQDAFVSAWRNLPRLRDRAKFDAWLGQMVVNRCRDMLRHRTRSREVALDEVSIPIRSQTDAALDRAAVNAAFDRLSVEHRLLLVSHHLDRTPVAELARRLGIPEGTAKWRLHAARQALQKALEVDR